MSRNRLAGKSILITGASAGIGKATALEFAGASGGDIKLVLVSRRPEPLQDLVKEIQERFGNGVKVHTYALDIAHRAAIADMIATLPGEFKPIDILVNNAGLARGRDNVGDIRPEDLNLMIDTNIVGLVNMTQAVLPMMLARGESGTGNIINIGSIAGRTPYPGGSIYCATKTAIQVFTDSLRRELIASRIRVMEIDPGQVETGFTAARYYGDEEKARAFYAGQQSLTAEDVAEIVVFAASRRENVVLADCVVVPSHQAAADVMWKG